MSRPAAPPRPAPAAAAPAGAPAARRVAVIGAGWAGLAAAVRATERGAAVTILDTAATPGGRARSLEAEPGRRALDNGQHILIGAYVRTLALMRTVGVDVGQVLMRRPLALVDASGRGLVMPPGSPLLAFPRAVLGVHGWTLGERLALLAAAAGWAARRFRAPARQSVAELTRGLPPAVRRDLVEPLCVAALNTPAAEASAAVFLRVLRDALFAGPGSADLLLPTRPLGDLLPGPAAAWLLRHGASVRWRTRVESLQPAADGSTDVPAGAWRVDGEPFDAVVLACGPTESARLVAAHAPAWAAAAAGLRYEPIVTVYLRCDDRAAAGFAQPMVALADGPDAPAQFAFDHAAIGGEAGRYALVVSGAAPWVARGLEATAEAARRQAAPLFAPGTVLAVERTIAEKRATFRCTPALRRPPAAIAPGLVAAGDHVEGPYPATLEGAVRAGEAAAFSVTQARPAPPG